MNREALERLGHDTLVDLVLRQEEVLEEYVHRLEDLENQVKDLTPGPLGRSPRQARLDAIYGTTTTPTVPQYGMTAQDAIRGAEALSEYGPTLAQAVASHPHGAQQKDTPTPEQYRTGPVPPHSAEQDDTARPCHDPDCPLAFHPAHHPHTRRSPSHDDIHT